MWGVIIFEAPCFGRRHPCWGERCRASSFKRRLVSAEDIDAGGERCGAECGLFVTFVAVSYGVEQVE